MPTIKKRSPLRRSQYFVYIVRCKSGFYYTGYTNNLERRLNEHNSGRGSKYLRGKRPVQLVYAKEYKYYKNALNAERHIKTLPKKRKEALIKKPNYLNTNC